MAEQLMRAQLKGSTASINSTAGYKGVLVLNTDTNHLHILTGEAGSNIELANKTDIPEEVDISGKADITYVDQQLATKQPVGDYATNTNLALKADKSYVDEQLETKQPTGDYATNAQLTSGLATKQPVGDYATNTALTQKLATKLDINGKASSASVADSANSVAWTNVTGTEKVRTTDTPITINDFGSSVDLGMIGE